MTEHWRSWGPQDVWRREKDLLPSDRAHPSFTQGERMSQGRGSVGRGAPVGKTQGRNLQQSGHGVQSMKGKLERLLSPWLELWRTRPLRHWMFPTDSKYANIEASWSRWDIVTYNFRAQSGRVTMDSAEVWQNVCGWEDLALQIYVTGSH